MERMIVTTFGTDAEAQRGVSALKDLNASGDITLYGVVVLGKDVSGKVTVRLGSGEIVEGTSTGLLTSAMLGLIAGPARMGTDTSLDALSGMLFELSQAGVDVRFAARVSDELRPGTVVVVARADEDWTVPVDTRMAALGGVVFRQPITNVIEDQDARDAAVLSAQSDALKAELEAVGERARSELQKSIDRVKGSARERWSKASKIRSLLAKCAYSPPFDNPQRRPMSSIVVAAKPRSESSARAASRICAMRTCGARRRRPTGTAASGMGAMGGGIRFLLLNWTVFCAKLTTDWSVVNRLVFDLYQTKHM